MVNDICNFDGEPSNNNYFIVLVNVFFLDCQCPSDGHTYHGHCFFVSTDSYTHSGAQVGNKKSSLFKLKHIWWLSILFYSYILFPIKNMNKTHCYKTIDWMQVNKKIFFVNQLAIEIQKWKSRLNTRRYYFQISKH